MVAGPRNAIADDLVIDPGYRHDKGRSAGDEGLFRGVSFFEFKQPFLERDLLARTKRNQRAPRHPGQDVIGIADG